MTDKYLQIKSIEQLKEESLGGSDFIVLLNYGLRSSKHIQYMKDSEKFWVWNLIDDSEQVLNEQQLMDKNITIVGDAMLNGAFFKEM